MGWHPAEKENGVSAVSSIDMGPRWADARTGTADRRPVIPNKCAHLDWTVELDDKGAVQNPLVAVDRNRARLRLSSYDAGPADEMGNLAFW